jgi:hypothetical protein
MITLLNFMKVQRGGNGRAKKPGKEGMGRASGREG